MASKSRRVRTTIAAVAVGGALGGGVWFATSAGASSVAPGQASGVATAAPGGPITAALTKLVANGTITQAQADAVTAELAASLPGRGSKPGMPGKPGATGQPPTGMSGRRGSPVALDAAAKALGTTVDELKTALGGGKTIAAVAGDKKVAVDAVIKAVVTAEQEQLAQAVEDGKLTQAQADAATARITERVTAMVNGTGPTGPMGDKGNGPRGSMDDRGNGRKGPMGDKGNGPRNPPTSTAATPSTTTA